MAKYLEIKNDNNVVIVDDKYNVPMLIAKTVVTTSSTLWTTVDISGSVYYPSFYYSRGKYSGEQILATWDSPSKVPFKAFENVTSLEGDRALGAAAEVESNLFVAARSLSGDSMIRAYARFVMFTDSTAVKLSVYVESEILNGDVEVVVYSLGGLKPKSHSLSSYSASGELVFDAMRPSLHLVGSLYGDVQTSKQVAATFSVDLPDGINYEDCYITTNSGSPYYASYRISSSGVSFSDTTFKTIMRQADRKITVSLERTRAVSGNNSSFGFGGFFEILVYCPYPVGLYL